MRRAIIQRPVFRFGRCHAIWFQNLRVQSTAENLTHIGSLPRQKSGTKAGRSRRGNREEGQNPVAGLPFWTVSHDMVSEPLCTERPQTTFAVGKMATPFSSLCEALQDFTGRQAYGSGRQNFLSEDFEGERNVLF